MRAGLLLALAGLTIAGCATSAPARLPGAIVVRSSQEPDSLNPYLKGMSASIDAYQPIFDGLLAVDNQMKFSPDLAMEVPTPENGGVRAEGRGMAVTYRLRKGVTWHDGHPFTSQDVAFTHKLVSDPKALVIERQGYDLVDRIETPDAHTVVVHFREIYAPYKQLYSAILPAHLLGKSKDFNKDPFNRAPVGTGPFMFQSWRSGDKMTYKANARYFKGKPKFDTLEFKFIPDDNSAFVQLKNGAIDVYQTVSLSQYKTLKVLPGLEVHATPALLWEHLSFNLEKPYFKDARVRRAIAHAINKDLLAEKVYDGIYKPAWSDQNPLSWAFSPDLVGKTPYDPALANRLLDEAGWVRGQDGIRVKDGQRFSVSFATTAGKRNRETAQMLIRYFLSRIGIEVRVANFPGATLFGAYPHGVTKGGKFDMAMWAWDTGPDPDNINTWHSDRIPPKGANVTRYRNPEVDRLLETATRTFRQDERQALYRKVSHHLAADLPNVPLLYWTVLDAVSDRVVGFKPNPTSAGNLWNIHEWQIKGER